MRSKMIGIVISTLLAGLGAASASTVFDINGNSTYSGTLTIDTVAGSLNAADVQFGTPPDFSNILSTNQGAADLRISVADGTTSPGPILFLSLDDGGTLIGFTGGTIDTAAVLGACNLASELCIGVPEQFGSADLSPETAATPLPAALPLFATGIGGLGLLGWRRKRKALGSSIGAA